MKLLTDKLYERIFINEYKQSTQLRVISGYASPEFLERVLREFCGKISLYIGMSEHDGIAIKNHQRFVELCNRFGSRLKVYYQIEGPPSHMKLIEFTSLTTKSTYIGSANFSENGFFKQREVMTKVDSFNDSIFTYQELISRLCLDPDIDIFIPFYEDISDIE
ncbi:phospholipase D family protein, partial [Enterococcus sp. 3C8_DIV0646]